MEKRTLLIYLLLILLFSCAPHNDETEIKKVFQFWQQSQIKKQKFVGKENCNWEYASKFKNKLILGFPEEIKFDYANLNGDHKLDALVTFFPNQCDGGNFSAWTQYKLLILSEKSNFFVDNQFFDKIKPESGFYHLDSLDNKTFFGTFYDFKEDDGYCCPSIKKSITINFEDRSLQVK